MQEWTFLAQRTMQKMFLEYKTPEVKSLLEIEYYCGDTLATHPPPGAIRISILASIEISRTVFR